MKCNGSHYNLDFYLKKGTPPKNYDLHVTKCVNGHNIKKYPNTSIELCAQLCDDNEQCKGFEYGASYNFNGGAYKPRDCQLQSSAKDW